MTKIIQTLLFLSIALLFTACSSKQSNPYTVTKPLSAYENDQTYNGINISYKLLKHYAQWREVKYKYGGNSKRGIDCSYLVHDTYRSYFDIDMPRTTLYQSQIGLPINKSDLKTGDLVFFITSKKGSRHVGIYLDHGDFMHVSTSKGVMISNLNNPYWRRHYWMSRRVLFN